MSNTSESTIELNRTSIPTLAPGVYIVGAGPGDPELLTVKAQKLLMQGDVILYADSLVPRQILKMCRPGYFTRDGGKGAIA
jgi:precorrin-4/cobalt-precorrin-4 C11-methyltransferase